MAEDSQKPLDDPESSAGSSAEPAPAEETLTEPEASSGTPRTTKASSSKTGVSKWRLRWEALVAAYGTVDPRSLGLFRIALGTLLFVDVLRRWPDLIHHFSNDGWLTNHYSLFRPMSSHQFSLYHAFSTLAEVQVLIVIHLIVNFLFLIGWHTRLMHVLAAILITSLDSRNIMAENGGFVVLNLLTIWSAFLPTGKRFSVDSLLGSLKTNELPSGKKVVSFAIAALILQYAVIYYFNVVHKGGPTWRDGTAVYYFFKQDRMITDFAAIIRPYLPLWFFTFLTWGTLIIESALVLLWLSPVHTHITRMLAALLAITLHLSIDSVVQLGPFSWAMVTVYVMFIPPSFWDWLNRRFSIGAKVPDHWLPLPATAPIRQWWMRSLAVSRESVVLFFVVCSATQVLMENHAVPPFMKPTSRPEWITAIVTYPRAFQGWSMFAPDPPRDDGVVIVDGLTVDGRHIDPLTGKETSFDLNPYWGFGLNQLWGDFQRRIWQKRNDAFWPGFQEYLKNYHLRTGNPKDRLVAFDVWWAHEALPPPPASVQPMKKDLMFSFGSMSSTGTPSATPHNPHPRRMTPRAHSPRQGSGVPGRQSGAHGRQFDASPAPRFPQDPHATPPRPLGPQPAEPPATR